MTTTNLPRY